MTLFDPEAGPHRRPIYCQVYQTYAPPSYLPPSCQDSTETYPTWAWSLINTVFVSATTVFNTVIFLAVLFLWLVNRQFHFKNQHSYDKKPLQPLQKPAKALKKAKKRLGNAAKNIKKKVGLKVNVPISEEAITLANQKKHKSFQSFLEDFEDEDEDDEDRAIENSLANNNVQKKRSDSIVSAGPETRSKKKLTQDVLHVASKIEVFSYLSPQAVKDILKYVEYVDFDNVGDVVFDTESLDGSMYAVVSGEVTTSLSINDTGTGRDHDSDPDFSFVAGPGEVITSMLTIITSLVREYQLQDAKKVLVDLAGVLGGTTSIVSHDMVGDSKIVIPEGMNVKAIATGPNTRLLRIPSRCFIAILERFPKDVYNICQTIVARLQRVTIQTLVKFLGLDAGIMGMGGPSVASSDGMIPEKKPRNTTIEWSDFEQSMLDDPSIIPITSSAITAAGSLLGLDAEDSQELKEGASIECAPPGSVICRRGDPPNALYLILKGSLEVGIEKNVSHHSSASHTASFQNGEHKKARRNKTPKNRQQQNPFANEDKGSTSFKPLFKVGPGNWCGLFSCFTHDASFITIRNPVEANTGAMLLKIPAETFKKVVSKYPKALIQCLLDIIDTIGDGAKLCVSPSLFLLDNSLDWMHVQAGEFISVRGEPCDSIFVVLNGRLRAESAKDDPKSNTNCEEYGRGATIGEVEALAEGNWTQSVYAIRHCEVARIPSRVMSLLMKIFPSAGLHFAKVIASQLHSRKGSKKPIKSEPSLLPSYALSIATIAVVPMSDEVDVSEFCSYFTKSLTSIAPTKLLTKKSTKDLVDDEFFKHRNQMLKVKLTRLLGDFEESNRLVVYESDYKYTWWTKLCVQQADCVLILVDSKTAPERKRVEELLAWAQQSKNVRIELVVIQSSLSQELSTGDERASDTLNNWSEQRPWISKHHQIRCHFGDHTEDFRRMSRRITGQSIGLVMGGGGARGLAHLGVIKALNEAGLAVDMVGGTSQGAFVGALLARNPDDHELLAASVGEFAKEMSSISNKIRDLTFPLTSFFSGHHFNRGIQKILKNARIQDFVLSFYCVSVDISNSRQMVHTKGLAWKYVRASMSLTGYLPPISENNCLLVDGGYMNVVPADVMAEMGAKKIIAVDVALEDKSEFYDYGNELSGLWLLWNSWNPFVQTVKVPSMGDINERLSWVSSDRAKKDIIKNSVDLFLRPPVSHIGTLEFDKMDEIVKIGYDYAKPLVGKWAKENGY